MPAKLAITAPDAGIRLEAVRRVLYCVDVEQGGRHARTGIAAAGDKSDEKSPGRGLRIPFLIFAICSWKPGRLMTRYSSIVVLSRRISPRLVSAASRRGSDVS